MTFGMTNAPATFQPAMNNLFAQHLDLNVVVYMDDILIYSKSEEEHNKHLTEVFCLLHENQFYVKLKKCAFFQEKVTFLGHDIDSAGIHISDSKAKKIEEWPIPRSKKELASFLGFMQFIAKSIKDYAKIVSPLTELGKEKIPWKWEFQEQLVFDDLK